MKKVLEQELNHILSNRDTLNYYHLLKTIQEKRFSLNDVNVTYRWISHWHEKGLLIGKYEEGKWRKFDLFEFVWLKMIIQMRKFNFSFEMIKRVKENLIQEIPVTEALGNKQVLEVIMKLAKEEKIDDIKKVLADQTVQDILNVKSINLFETLIMDIISFHNSYSLFINSNQVVPVKHSSLEYIASMQPFNSIIRGSFISISISEILRDFMLREHGIKQKTKLALLSAEEEKVLSTLRDENLKSVTVKYGKSQKIEFLEIVKEEKFDKRARLMDFILTNGYQDITIKTQNGDVVYCENKRKIAVKQYE